MKREIPVSPIVPIGILILAAVTAVVWFRAAAIPNMFFAAIGMTAITVVASPFLWLKKYDLFSPWTIVMLTVLLGCTTPAVAMSLGWPSESYLEAFSLLGQPPSYFYYPGMVLILGLTFFTIGYFAIPSSVKNRYSFGRKLDRGRLYAVMFVCVMISLVSTGAFIKFTGGFSSSRLSAKRTTIRTLDVKEDKELAQYGHLRSIASLSSVALVGLLAFWLTRRERITLMRLLILVGILLLSCAIPFYSSSRASVVWVLLAMLGVGYYAHQRHFFKLTGLILLTGFLVVVAMTAMRNPLAEIHDKVTFFGQRLLLNRNGPDLAKTSHIINGLPNKLSYQYGKTIAVWIIAPIPRAIYPGKPLIHYGPIIGQQIYGNKVSGVPPGLIAELFLNFHLPGVIFGCLGLGWGLRKLYEVVMSFQGDPAIAMSLYAFAILPLPFRILGNSIGNGIVTSLVNIVIVLVIVYVCTVPVQYRAPSVAFSPQPSSRPPSPH